MLDLFLALSITLGEVTRFLVYYFKLYYFVLLRYHIFITIQYIISKFHKHFTQKALYSIWFLTSVIPNLLKLDYYQVIIDEITENGKMAFEYIISVRFGLLPDKPL